MSDATQPAAPAANARKPSILLVGSNNPAPLNTASMILRGAGYPVVNPMDFRGLVAIDQAEARRRFVRLMLECDQVVTLPGCDDNPISVMCCNVARDIEVPVTTYKALMREIMGEG